MTQEFDAQKSYLAVKASEKMIAFVGFVFPLEEDGKTKEGVVKIKDSLQNSDNKCNKYSVYCNIPLSLRP